MKWLALTPLLCVCAMAQMRTIALPSNSPVVTLRLVFTTGAAQDPEDKPGLARLTAEMLSGGGTKDLTYKELVDAFFPMAASLSSQVDEEMTVFFGATAITASAVCPRFRKSPLTTCSSFISNTTRRQT